MGSSDNRRRSTRIAARFDTLYGFETLYPSERQEGSGMLAEISHRGAALEDTSAQPRIGARVRLYVFTRPVAPFEFIGDVVRHTKSGFAIEFEKLDPESESFVDVTAAIAGLQSHLDPDDRVS